MRVETWRRIPWPWSGAKGNPRSPSNIWRTMPLKDDAIRTFVAIPVDAAVKQYAWAVQDGFCEVAEEVRWVSRDNLHLTVRFLGELPAKGVEHLIEGVREAARELRPYRLKFAGVGAFPSTQRPRVLWIGVSEGTLHLEDTAAKLDKALLARGFGTAGEKFRPHLTIGRVRALPGSPGLTQALSMIRPPAEEPAMAVRGLAVMKSTLTPKGPLYERLFEAELSAGG